MNKIFLCLLAIIIATNISMAESYLCEDIVDGMSYKLEYIPGSNNCNSFLNNEKYKNDPYMVKFFQEQYQACMQDEQIAINAYKKGKCKALTVKRYNVGSKKCEDKFLNGNKIFSGCFD